MPHAKARFGAVLLSAFLLTILSGTVSAQDQNGPQPAKQENAPQPSPRDAKKLDNVTVTGVNQGFIMISSGRGGGHITNLAPVRVFASANRSPAQDNGPNGCNDSTGLPIQISSGTKLETYPVFALPGEMGLEYTLYYNTATQPSHWTSNFDYSLITDCSDEADNPTGRCTHTTVHRPDGSTMKFSGGPDASAYLETFENDQSIANPVATLSRDSTTGNYILQDEDSLKEVYSSSGQILSITDPSGIGWTFQYASGVTVAGAMPIGVTHTNGQSISIAAGPPTQSQQNGQNVLGQVVTVSDPAGNAYTFDYGDAYTPNAAITDVASMSLPGSPATVVDFKYSSFSVEPYGDVLSEVDYNGVPYAYTTYVTTSTSPYYEWANSTSLADGSELDSVAYATDSAGNLAATITNPLGHVSVNGGFNYEVHHG